MNLDGFQTRQATTRRESAEDAIKGRIPETYHWLLVPTQPDPKGPVEWEEIRLQGSDTLAVRASKKLRNEELARHPLRRHRSENGARRHPPLARRPRLHQATRRGLCPVPLPPPPKNTDVLLSAISDGLSLLTWRDDTFAYAEGFDTTTARYQGLRGGQQVHVSSDGPDLLVKPDVASRQLEAYRKRLAPVPESRRYPDQTSRRWRVGVTIDDGNGGGGGGGGTDGGGGPVVTVAQPVRFHGSSISTSFASAETPGQVAQDIVQHLSSLVGSRVKVTLEIEATSPTASPPPSSAPSPKTAGPCDSKVTASRTVDDRLLYYDSDSPLADDR